MATVLAPDSTLRPAASVPAGVLAGSAAQQLHTAPNLYALVESLVQSGQASDAVAAIAHALPRPLVISWVHDFLSRDSASRQQPGLQLANAWLQDPTEEMRQKAADFIGDLDLERPDEWLGAAVAWSGGSLAPPGYVAVPPGPELTARAAVAALRVSAGRNPETFLPELENAVAIAVARFSVDEPVTEARDAASSQNF